MSEIIGLLLLLAGALLLPLHIDDVMNLDNVIVTHFCAVKHLKVPNISRADHIPALIEEHSY